MTEGSIRAVLETIFNECVAKNSDGKYFLKIANPDGTDVMSTNIDLDDLSNVGTDTETSGNILIADGDSWESKVVSGDISLSAAGAVVVNKIKGIALGTTTATNGNVLVADGTDWDTSTPDNAGLVAKSGAQTIADVKTFSSFPVTPSSAPSTDYQVANKKYVDDTIISKDDYIINLPAQAWDYPAANYATYEYDTGTNGGIGTVKFTLTDEAELLICIPSDINTSGTVYFKADGYSDTADGNEIQLRLSHSSKDKGENWDAAYSTKDSSDYTCDANQDEYDEVKWNETVSNLGWAADDITRIKLSRIALDDGTDVASDWRLVNLRIRIPRT